MPTLLFSLSIPSELRIKLARCIGFRNLPAILCVSSAARMSLDLKYLWHLCCEREVPQVFLNADMLLSTHRRIVMDVCKHLDHIAIASGTRLQLDNIHDAQRLAKLLNNARERVSQHLASGGRVARIIVGDFCFARKIGGTATKFTLSQAGTLGLPDALGGHLQLKLEVNSKRLLLKARHTCDAHKDLALGDAEPSAPLESSPIRLVTDVTSVSRTFPMTFRRAPLCLNGDTGSSSNGIFAAPHLGGLSRRAVAAGHTVCCVLCILDDVPEARKGRDIASCLNLESTREGRFS
eukprot:TRINITY_DN39617_c0_g1_i1.p1 TRINITY_DN39617_c0_g1~~TRINITY_DN39617_c0_g1_i1.p1  ORF type:complete len:293 (+),score=38.94 TRINITY_DN39617_c0_g1_i1:36-914(+)